MKSETNIKRTNECKRHPECEGCKLSILFNGYNKLCFELSEQEVDDVLKEKKVKQMSRKEIVADALAFGAMLAGFGDYCGEPDNK